MTSRVGGHVTGHKCFLFTQLFQIIHTNWQVCNGLVDTRFYFRIPNFVPGSISSVPTNIRNYNNSNVSANTMTNHLKPEAQPTPETSCSFITHVTVCKCIGHSQNAANSPYCRNTFLTSFHVSFSFSELPSQLLSSKFFHCDHFSYSLLLP